MTNAISPTVLNVLMASTIDGNLLKLPDLQLERPLYTAVNKVLTTLGGKWNRSKKAHVFDSCPEEKLEIAIQTGTYTDTKKLYQFFETPKEIAEIMVDLADITGGQSVCEPSAGKGAIISQIDFVDLGAYLTCIELQPENVAHLESQGYRPVIQDDFLNHTLKYDVFIANPPFSKQQDIDHVNHMLDLTNDGGTVVSVMSASVLWRDNKKAVDFRERINALDGTFIQVDSGAFKESGTMVETVIVHVQF